MKVAGYVSLTEQQPTLLVSMDKGLKSQITSSWQAISALRGVTEVSHKFTCRPT